MFRAPVVAAGPCSVVAADARALCSAENGTAAERRTGRLSSAGWTFTIGMAVNTSITPCGVSATSGPALNRAWLAGDVPDTFVPFRTDPAGGVANGSPFPKRTTGRRGPVAVFANPCVTDVRKLRAPAMRIEQPAPFPHMPSFHFSDASRSSIAFSASIALYPNADLQAYSRSNGRSAAAPCFFR